MSRVGRAVAAAALLLVLAGMPARATQICGWIVEKIEANEVHQLDLWLQADGDLEFLYKIGGEGILSEGSRMHSPGRGTFLLHPGKADRPWGFGATLSPPGTIDIIADIRAKPADIFDETPTPLLASFTFHRAVPAGEKRAPPVFAKKQCATVK